MHVYFLGIGGAGIGPLAQIAAEAGYDVSGSDKQNSNYIDYLKAHSVTDIAIGDSPDLIAKAHALKPIDWVVFSSALPMEESGKKQLEYIKSTGIKCTKRDQFINELLARHNLQMIAVAGTHGKTTTTAILAWLFKELNQPISYLLPAKVSFGEMGEYNPSSRYFLYEADEFDRNFLSFKPKLSVISGVSYDHQEIYPTRQDYINAFKDFISSSSQAIFWSSDNGYLGLSSDNLLVLDDKDPNLAKISLKGEYNRRDGLLAVNAVSQLLGVKVEDLIESVNKFPGLSRRMEQISPGLYSDYAHTPDKIKGAMSAASETAKEANKKLIIVYEPLHNRRQVYVQDEYKDCFKAADHVYWLPSYLAREDPDQPIISSEQLIAKLDNPSIAKPARLDAKLVSTIRGHLDKGDMVVAMTGGGGGSLDDWLRQHFS